jgi:signal transduction histidine kinase
LLLVQGEQMEPLVGQVILFPHLLFLVAEVLQEMGAVLQVAFQELMAALAALMLERVVETVEVALGHPLVQTGISLLVLVAAVVLAAIQAMVVMAEFITAMAHVYRKPEAAAVGVVFTMLMVAASVY